MSRHLGIIKERYKANVSIKVALIYEPFITNVMLNFRNDLHVILNKLGEI